MSDPVDQRPVGTEQALSEDLLEALHDGVIAVCAQGRIRYLNPCAERLTGHSRSRVVGRPLRDILRVAGDDGVQLDCHGIMTASGEGVVGQRGLLAWGDRRIPIECSIAPIGGGGAVILLHHLSEAQDLSRRLIYQAKHDPLTGLPNRFSLQQVLVEVHRAAESVDSPFALLLLDLDRFKIVNDSYGHATGDRVLAESARRMEGVVRRRDVIGRWGGEEFLCILPETPRVQALEVAERIRRVQGQVPVEVDGRRLGVTVSVGVASYPEDADRIEPLLTRADAALYEAKRLGRNRVRSAELVRGSIFSIVGQVEAALASGRLLPAYQDIVELDSARPVAEEALARLVREDGTVMDAHQFVPASEKVQLVHRIDRQIALQTLRRCVSRTMNGCPVISHFVNISADFLRREALVDEVLEAAKRSCAACGDRVGAEKPLVIEVTEREFLDDLDEARRVLDPFTEFGVRLAIDDFGSGYSSLRYLADLPVSFLKLEAGMVRRVHADRRVRAILQRIQDMAADLGIVTIAEGIEQQATLDTLREMGVDWGQGYLFARPVLQDDPGH
ncbi:MAG: EAL domain-containing protein [Chromatiales bacterium]